MSPSTGYVTPIRALDLATYKGEKLVLCIGMGSRFQLWPQRPRCADESVDRFQFGVDHSACFGKQTIIGTDGPGEIPGMDQ